MSMTLSDRMTRGTYLLDQGDDQPGVICLSYTWNDDALKWLPLPVDERVRLMLHALKQIYPDVDIARHIVGDPITVSWEHDPNFMGAFKANLPGHYRYQRRLSVTSCSTSPRTGTAASFSPAMTFRGPPAGPRAR
jgi:lysine 2-monooxygenase